MITEDQHLLVCLQEECSEISHRIGKALRFGIDDKDPTIENSIRERDYIANEIDDLTGVVMMLRDRRILREPDFNKARNKQLKVLKYMDYAREAGALA